MTTHKIRVRFAPAPTGMMHLGNIRTALMNYLMAQQKQGTFVLRIEDTDAERNFDPNAVKIQEDLAWLGLTFDEGPGKDGGHGPYFQSERNHIYQEVLQTFINKQLVYRCFCSSEELDKKRQRQIALKQPPRYDKTCFKLSADVAAERAAQEPFIWRMRLDPTQTLTITDLSHGPVTFEMKNFSDFPVTRQDGSVTFMFANFVDDVDMKITCVIRGEDHLSNTAGQAAMYHALGAPLPTFWHMPILCNLDGSKLSKRDFGFSLRDLRQEGFLPGAILNYLALIGVSFEKEIMSLPELITSIDFEHMSSTGQIKYDVEKLRWVNQKWIMLTPLHELTSLCKPYLADAFGTLHITDAQLGQLLKHVQPEMITLKDCVHLLSFVFTAPTTNHAHLAQLAPTAGTEKVITVIKQALHSADTATFFATLKTLGKEHAVPTKELFSCVRYLLTGSEKGLGMAELLELLDYATIKKRLSHTA